MGKKKGRENRYAGGQKRMDRVFKTSLVEKEVWCQCKITLAELRPSREQSIRSYGRYLDRSALVGNEEA